MFGRLRDQDREEGLLKVAEVLSLYEGKMAAISPSAVRGTTRELAKNPGGFLEFLTTPFRNVSEGYKDYRKLAPIRDKEIAALQQRLQRAASESMAGGATPEITESMAKKVWKKAVPVSEKAAPNTQQRISEARGRMIAGGLQIGIPVVAGGLYLRSKAKENEGAKVVNPQVPYNAQSMPPVYAVTRNGVHQLIPDRSIEYAQKVSAALPKFEGAITGAKAALTTTENMAAPTINKLRRVRGMPKTASSPIIVDDEARRSILKRLEEIGRRDIEGALSRTSKNIFAPSPPRPATGGFSGTPIPPTPSGGEWGTALRALGATAAAAALGYGAYRAFGYDDEG